MTKEQDKKETKTQSGKKTELTEWQKRNIEFLKKKEAEEAEEKERQEKLRLERTSHLKKEDEKSKETTEPTVEDEDDKDDVNEEEIVPQKEKTELTPLQKARRRAYPVLLVSGLILLLSIFLVTPVSKQKTVTVLGASMTTSDAVLAASGIKKSDYFFSLIFNHSKYEKNILKNNKFIKETKLVYHFPNKFTIKVKEYGIVAYAQTDDGYQPILENGTRLGVVGAANLPDTFLTINLSSEKDIQKLIKAFSKLDKDLVSQIRMISSANSTTTTDLLLLEMHDGNTIRVPLSEIVKKLPYYSKIKKNLTDTSIIDMEVGLYTTTETIESDIAAEKEKAKSESSDDNSETNNTESTTESSEGGDTQMEPTNPETENQPAEVFQDNNMTENQGVQ